jgi:putative chitinase
MNRTLFFNSINPTLFDGKISPSQTEGINAIIDEWDASTFNDLRWLAYLLASVYHETGKEMQPTREKGGDKYLRTKPYYPYVGMDLLQTSWKYNYQKVKDFTGRDVITHPNLIADLKTSAKVALHFMVNGLYTGKKLSDYFNHSKSDWINARRIINALDKADLIASYAKSFFASLTLSQQKVDEQLSPPTTTNTTYETSLGEDAGKKSV